MSGQGKLGWLARRLVGNALSGLKAEMARQTVEIQTAQVQMAELEAQLDQLRGSMAVQAIEIERLRIEAGVVGRRLDSETAERLTLGHALFERIERRRA